MAYINWKTDYNIDIVQIDTQHKKLVATLNELYQAMLVGKGKEVLLPILAALEDYTNTHFKAEEYLMKQYGFPGYEKHCREHAAFIQNVKEFQEQYQSKKIVLSIQTSDFLKNWLSSHILKTDHEYRQFLLDRGVR